MKRFLVLLGVLVLMLGMNAYAEGDVSEGYVFYENELFSTEVPADWSIQKVETVQNSYAQMDAPHEGSIGTWCMITFSAHGFEDSEIEELEASYDFEHKFYETTLAGQSAKVIEYEIELGGTVQRAIYTSTPSGQRFVLHFRCPKGDTAYDFSPIQEIMDHFIDHIQWK